MERGVAIVWETWLRRAPLGVVVLSSVLGLLGSGFFLGGAWLAFARRDVGWAVWAGALVVGPLILYVAVRLLCLTSWAWSTMILLVGLLLASSVFRLMVTPGIPTVPIVEILLELGALAYMLRPGVRRAFGR
jgi:hypothetical protein